MKQEIKYKGYSVGVSDYDCADGELSAAHSLLNEEGSLRVLEEAKRLCQLPAGCRLMYIHSTAAYRHYIIGYEREQQRGIKELYWMDASIVEDATSVVSATVIQNEIGLTPYSSAMPPNSSSMQSNNHLIKAFDSAVDEMVAQGNTLVVMTADGMHYCLWRPDDRRYDYLGQKPPELEMQFTVSDAIQETGFGGTYIGARQVDVFTLDQSTLSAKINSQQRSDVTNGIWAMVNKVNAEIRKHNLFYAPFFVRYCYRFTDGSMSMHSAPVFIPVSIPCSQKVEVGNVIYDLPPLDEVQFKENSDDYPAIFIYTPSAVALQYLCNGSTIVTLKEKWRDIVTSVDVFVSSPVIPEKTDEDITDVVRQGDLYQFVNSQYTSVPVTSEHPDQYEYLVCRFPKIPDAEYLEKINNVSSFYKIASLDINSDEFAVTGFADLPIKSDVLATLEAQEVMTDDYKSHNTLLPQLASDGSSTASLYIYNRRLFVTGIREQLFHGFGLEQMLPYEMSTERTSVACIEVSLRTAEGIKKVVHQYDPPLQVSFLFLYTLPLFYPDNRAFYMRIYIPASGQSFPYYTLERPMTACPFLNGAATDCGILSPSEPLPGHAYSLPSPSPVSLSLASKLYVSEIDNPFLFNASGIITIGTGTVLAVRSATKALSEGQFGQHPLYAFTTDGVWALTVATDGTFHAVQPVCRDICSDAESITQLDDAVLFATDRGVMVLSGATAKCLTDTLMTDAVVDLRDVLPKYSQLQDAAAAAPFREYLQGCRMVYDYTHQRVTLYNPTWESNARKYTYGYVYSIKTGLWGLTETDLAYGVNSYPDTLAVDDERYLVSLSDYVAANNGTPGHGLMVTRPLKLGDGNALKTVHTVLQRGYFRKNAVATILWGSRDLMNWHLVASSATHELRNMHGTPYKWFRIGAVVDLRRGESLSGATVEFDLRYTDKLH